MQWRSAATRIRAICIAGACLWGTFPATAEVAFDCVVQPNRTIALGSPVTGILSEVLVGRGDAVTKGQILARLEAELETATVTLNELRASDTTSIEAQQARLLLAEERMRRAEQLLERGATTREAFDQAKAELDVSTAELARLKVQQELAALELLRARATLARRTIRSPIGGIVSQRALSPGEFVTQEAWIMRIADLDPLHVEVFLPTGYFDQLAVGQTGHVVLRQPAGGRFDAEVVVVDSVFDATSNTFGVRLALPNADLALPAGQRCKMTLDVTPVERAGGGFD